MEGDSEVCLIDIESPIPIRGTEFDVSCNKDPLNPSKILIGFLGSCPEKDPGLIGSWDMMPRRLEPTDEIHPAFSEKWKKPLSHGGGGIKDLSSRNRSEKQILSNEKVIVGGGRKDHRTGYTVQSGK